jgi:transcriptional regulator with XRE-family HTH domain
MNTARFRKFRKSFNLTQREVAMLLGYASQRAYSDVELGLKRPALGTAIGCCILFDAPLRDLFPDLVGFIERDLLARAGKLNDWLATQRHREEAAARIAELIGRIGGLPTSE